MTAENPIRRTVTAREGATKLGISERTVRRIAAEPREAFVKRSRERQDLALTLKESGLKYREIGDRMNCTTKAAEGLVYQARKRRISETSQPAANNVDPVLPGQTSIDDVPGE